MRILHIDLETFSSVDLKKSGLYKYVQSLDFSILLFAYAYDNDPVRVIDLANGELIDLNILADLTNPSVVKMAHNAAFEYYCLSKFYKTELTQWYCTMIHALYCGLPASLDAVGSALKFPQDKRKLASGKSLIRYFCIPCKPTKSNQERTRNLPRHDKSKWDLFKAYCGQDVATERTVYDVLSIHPVPESEWNYWRMDQRINIKGVSLDTRLIEGALLISDQSKEDLTKRAKDITNLDNPNSVAQLKDWIDANSNLELDNLNKNTVSEVLAGKEVDEQIMEMLKIRQELGKTSVKKYVTMQTCICEDGRIRGILQFYGAGRTGRWAGRLVQVHNLPRNYLGTLDVARELVIKQRASALELIYGNIPDTLSQLIRTAFVPSSGCHFAVADFSAIEARVIAWLAGEQWRLDVFRTHGKIYEASASTMFGVPLELIAKGNPEYALRGKGKVAELALGYGGGVAALIQMGALTMGLTEEELPDIVRRWRGSSRRIYDYWYKVQRAVEEVVQYGVITTLEHGLVIHRDAEYLMIQLPSGRSLFYNCPYVAKNERGNMEIYYSGVDQTNKKYTSISTWGGKLVENIVQAVARDLLASAMMNLENAGYSIAFHVHDEVILEIPNWDSSKNLANAIELMCQLPKWAEGLPLNADGFDCATYYKKE